MVFGRCEQDSIGDILAVVVRELKGNIKTANRSLVTYYAFGIQTLISGELAKGVREPFLVFLLGELKGVRNAL
jgi:hypothetical protein